MLKDNNKIVVNYKNISKIEEDSSITQDYARSSFFVQTTVKGCKNILLKTRLQTLIFNKGMSEVEFYKKIGLSKQYWYALSNGIFKPTIELKVKIARELETDSAVIWGIKEGGISK